MPHEVLGHVRRPLASASAHVDKRYRVAFGSTGSYIEHVAGSHDSDASKRRRVCLAVRRTPEQEVVHGLWFPATQETEMSWKKRISRGQA